MAAQAAHRRLGMVAETWCEGRAGAVMRAVCGLTLAGAATAALAAAAVGRSPVGGLALLAGSVCTRFGGFAAGIASAEDPKYTVAPQRKVAPQQEGG
ncbi:hypothetical protein ACFV0T_38005 [Streptomyces sp. NPDC059582]|uniref:hypothetical protein n=1 Tax=Streptomyces sp. NPDC059582 TaxID=3346875 RepID=UPI0036B45CB3